ncbi:hypothetical protein [Ekhidna sp.]|uniref:hypothetical protein n=1 Tax=Ekhidna sp. TaxID=2608089 RepID=UPI003B5B1870
MKKFLWILLPAIGFYLHSLLNSWGEISLDHEVNLVELASILTTVILGLYFVEVLEKQKENRRIEKDLIIQKIGYLSDEIEGLHTYVKGVQVELDTINSDLKQIYANIKYLKNLLEKSNKNGVSPISNVSDIVHSIRSVRKLMTYTSPAGDTDLKIEEGKTKYSRQRLEAIRTETNELKFFLFKWQIEVNKTS